MGLLTLLLLLALSVTVRADESGPTWITPYGPGVDKVLRYGEVAGWGPVAASLRGQALKAYRGFDGDAEAWYLLARWAELWAKSEGALTQAWTRAVSAASLGHGNIAGKYESVRTPLGAAIDADAKRALMGDLSFSRTFFTALRQTDRLTVAVRSLARIWAADPQALRNHPELVTALVLVMDIAPPPDYPHGQVDAEVLPRTWPDVVKAYQYWSARVGSGALKRTERPENAREWMLVVATLAPFEDLDWARASFALPTANLGNLYHAVPYVHHRAAESVYDWPLPTYGMPAILANGGICVDQAYLAVQAARARGIPALLFRGTGFDGRHAWFGYREDGHDWVLDAGRIAADEYVTGLAYDPQDWRLLSDHEVGFLSERWSDRGRSRKARTEWFFAQLLFSLEAWAEAREATERALRWDRRWPEAWELHAAAAARAPGVEPRDVEAILREAAGVFREVPDVADSFRLLLVESLEARGETSRATAELNRMASYHRYERPDLALSHALQRFALTVRQEPAHICDRQFRLLVQRHAGPSGIAVFDYLVKPYLERVARDRSPREARRLLDHVARSFAADPGSQLDKGLTALRAELATDR